MNQAEELLASLPNHVIEELKLLGVVLVRSIEAQSTEVIRLTNGLSNQNYLITNGEYKWVLRCNAPASSQLCDRKAEVKNWRLAAEANLAPTLFYVSSDHAFYLSEYIEEVPGRQWFELSTAKTAHPLIDDASIWPDSNIQVLSLLQGLASLSVPDNIIENSKQWQIYLKQLRDIELGYFHEKNRGMKAQWLVHFNQLLGLEGKIYQWLEELNVCALAQQYSHRDLNPHNLLYKNDKLFCIDFEYACGSHPLFDLAGILSTHDLSTQQRHALIDNYLFKHPKLTSDAKATLPAAINIYWVFATCWSLLMASDNSSASASNSLKSTKISNPHQAEEYLNCFEQFFSLID